jgi:hypothetical protein
VVLVRGRHLRDDWGRFESPELQVGYESEDQRRSNAISEKCEQKRKHPAEGSWMLGIMSGTLQVNDRGDD